MLSIIERDLPSPAEDRRSQTGGTEAEPDNGEDEAYIAMDRLYHLQDNPFKNIGDMVDFVRQMLQVVALFGSTILNDVYTVNF